MGLRFVEKGDLILKRKDYDMLKKAQAASDSAVSMIETANGPNKDSPFRDGFYAQAEKDAKKSVRFLNVLINNLEGAK